MLFYIYQALNDFRKMFSRRSTWLVFCMVILGFMGTREISGVTSLCRFWCLGACGYHMFLHFFRVSAWSNDALRACWSAFILSKNETIDVDGRAVLLGDHTYVAKDGRRMPCVVTLHQHSETQSKPSYFRGHCWAAMGMLVGTMAAPFCIPLDTRIAHIGEDDKEEKSKETLGTRIVQMAIDFAARHDLPSIFVLDAFFP